LNPPENLYYKVAKLVSKLSSILEKAMNLVNYLLLRMKRHR